MRSTSERVGSAIRMPSVRARHAIPLAVLAAVAALTSCDKSITVPSTSLPAITPVSVDANAGTWKMLVLTSPDQVVVPDPAATSSMAYQAELTSLKAAQAAMTAAQRAEVQYWTGAGVLRWNEIERELVARYNLPPAPKPDGSYPLPDAENPFGDPNFPFANPPYASRAYSYVSVAQYEALKAAWHYMNIYNRPSPYITDSGIQSLMPETGLPAYPSYDAVLSGVTAEMLKLLFPAALEEITRHAADQRNAAL